MACWDILGKWLGAPVWRLLGGKCRDPVRAYANGWYQVERTPEAIAERARKVMEMGYTALKVDPFGAGSCVDDFTVNPPPCALENTRLGSIAEPGIYVAYSGDGFPPAS